jgi:cyclic pyranopterin monophosphate synthase
MSRLSHVDDAGTVRMVDVGGKPETRRRARAEGFLKLLPTHLAALGSLPKGDALTTAQIAGILAGKRTGELIPLCHPLPLTFLDVRLELAEDGIRIEAVAETDAKTGVEIEAYTAVTIAGVTLVDMLKGVDPDLTLTGIRLLEKTGGKAPWRRA